MAVLVGIAVDTGAQNAEWDFVYGGDRLPQTIVDAGGTDWQPRAGEITGRPIYESIVSSPEAQVGGLWSRRDDNSPDPNAPSGSSWARGYTFGNNIYSRWNGRMTLVMRIRDLGTDSEKSVVDITNNVGNYWTLGHVRDVGWEYGQTNDSRNANGLSDVQAGGLNKFVTIRINIIDDVAGDNTSVVRAWQDGNLVYDSVRGNDIATGQFGEIAFRRTSGGNQQQMEIDWIYMKFGAAWEPGFGGQTPAGFFDGTSVDGAVSLDTTGVIRTAAAPGLSRGENPLFQVDANGVPTQFDIFYLGFDAYRDLEVTADGSDNLTGIIALDKYAGVHTYTVTGPNVDYRSQIASYNAANPDKAVPIPYFPFNVNIDNPNDGIGRDLELAVDWRPTTNAFQGFYILDAFGGVHYTTNPKVLRMLEDNPGQAGINKFFSIFGFKPIYLNDYAGVDGAGSVQTKPAPYFFFGGDSGGLPIAKDLEVMVRFETLTTPTVADSLNREALAAAEGIDDHTDLFQPIAINPDRLDYTKPIYAPNVAVTDGYAILDGYGAVHTILEDKTGNPIPAPWENAQTGLLDPSVDAPYFANPPLLGDGDDFNIAVDIEIMPNGQGYCLLTRLGEVFVVNAVGKTSADNFVTPGIEARIPIFGFDAARDLKLVSNGEGKIVGMYVVDRFGTVHRAGNVPRLPSSVLYFPNGYANDLELSPYSRPITGPSN